MSKIEQAIGVTLFESDNFGGWKFPKDGVSTTLRSSKQCAGIVEVIQLDNEVKVIGQMDNTIDHTFESANRVYDEKGLSPTIPTCAGGVYNLK